jgi:hypothetical protein
MINLIQDSESLGCVLNPGNFEQRAGVLPTPTKMAYSVQNKKFYSVYCADYRVKIFASSNDLKLNYNMMIPYF